MPRIYFVTNLNTKLNNTLIAPYILIFNTLKRMYFLLNDSRFKTTIDSGVHGTIVTSFVKNGHKRFSTPFLYILYSIFLKNVLYISTTVSLKCLKISLIHY